jgi:hypothetical protein
MDERERGIEVLPGSPEPEGERQNKKKYGPATKELHERTPATAYRSGQW